MRAVTQVQNAYSSRDITFMHNHIEHVLSNETLNANQLCAIHLVRLGLNPPVPSPAAAAAAAAAADAAAAVTVTSNQATKATEIFHSRMLLRS